MKQAWNFIALIILLPVIVFGLVSWYQKKFDVLPVLGPGGHAVKQFSGTDQNGDLVNNMLIEDKIAVVNLFFTRCPVVCPKMMKGMLSVQQRTRGAVFLSFSVDPERDDQAQLLRYSQQLGMASNRYGVASNRHGEASSGRGLASNWHLVTGIKKDIYRFARKELLMLATDGDGGETDFIHSDNLVLLDRQQRIRGYYKGTEASQVNLLINDINKLQNE